MASVERVDWSAVVRLVRSVDDAKHRRTPRFSDSQILLTLLWARLHHRPVCWACRPASWPLWERRRTRPSPTTMTRRLRSASVVAMIERLESAVQADAPAELVHAVDGKPLVVSRHSTDPDARHGRGAGGYDKGYKLHVVCGLSGRVCCWRVTPLSTPEHEMARRMVQGGGISTGYLLADTLFDWDTLHTRCEQQGVRLLAPRRPTRRGRGTRQRGRVGAARQACIAAMETPHACFARDLHGQRAVVERVFARLETRWHIGHPPFYVRRLRRVRLWVQAALILDPLVQRAA